MPFIRVGAIKHQSNFDKTSFTVEAGKQIEFIFDNSNILPHNLV